MKKTLITSFCILLTRGVSFGFETRPFVISDITDTDIIVSDIQTSAIATRILRKNIDGEIPDIEPGVVAIINCTPDKKIHINNATSDQTQAFNTAFENIVTFFADYDPAFQQKAQKIYENSPTENMLLKALLNNAGILTSFNTQGDRTTVKDLSTFCFTKPYTSSILGRDRFFLSTIGRDITKGTKIITRAQRGANETYSMPAPPKPAGEDTCPSGSCDTEEHIPPARNKILENYVKNFKATEEKKALLFSADKTWVPLEYFPVDRIIIHHTAGAYAATKKDGINYMKSVQKYHAQTLGRGDIGYQFLIDGEGNIYEGRRGGMQTVGAHVFAHNRGSVGISLMSDKYYSPKMLRSLLELIIYLGDQYNLNLAETGIFKKPDLSGTQTGPVVVAHKELFAGKPHDPEIPMDVFRKFVIKLQKSPTFKNALYTDK